MQYFLIDFGASFVKTCMYDQETDSYDHHRSLDSPFQRSDKITREKLRDFINSLSMSDGVDGIVSCSILGGQWRENIYHSWKSREKITYGDCLISGLFCNQETHHIHKHHGGSVEGLIPLGKINNKLFYSSLGDTYCVIESANLKENEYIINIGTGSQVATLHNGKLHLDQFIPAGRSFLIYEKFFNDLNLNFFEELNNIRITDVINSTLEIDLNLFPQAIRFNGGGFIKNITEDNFTVNNLLSSIMREFVLQYGRFINDDSKTHIRLMGGIPKKLTILKELFKYYFNDKEIAIDDSQSHSTHIGMSNLIRKYL